MKFHPDVLAAHAEFGGDLNAMQALYDRPVNLARIAELEAENVRKAECIQQCLEIIAARDEALSRTGAVKVDDAARRKIELWFFRDMNDDQRLMLFSIFGMPVNEIGKTHGHQRKALRRILSALEPAAPEGQQPEPSIAQKEFDEILAESKGGTARLFDGTFGPEGQQEPVAWLSNHGIKLLSEGGTMRAIVQASPDEGEWNIPVYTRPSEQAVTEAMVEAAEHMMTAHYERPLKAWELTALHESLKAAMEAGR